MITTEAIGDTTLTVDVALFPSLVAVMATLPTEFAVTNPADDTDAIDGFNEAHVTKRPESALPLASLVVAVSCCVLPTAKLTVADEIVILATEACITDMSCWPDRVPTVATTFTCPGATAVTTPLDVIVAIAFDPVDQDTKLRFIDVPFWSTPAALAVAVWPTWIDATESETVTVVRIGTKGAVGVVSLLPPPLQALSKSATPVRKAR